jgi:hypothetical protein
VSDERLREAERRWRASAAVEDEVALLRERLRVGQLDESRLRLAAGLEHPAASVLAPAPQVLVALVERRTRTVLGERSTRWDVRPAARARWTFGEEALRRACASAARCGLRAWETFVAGRSEPPVALDLPGDLRLLVDVVTGARVADAEQLAEVAERLHEAVLDGEAVGLAGAGDAEIDALNAVANFADLLAPDLLGADPLDELLGPDLLGADQGLPRRPPDDDPAMWCLALALNAVGADAVKAALLEDVAAWALGHGDPLREWAKRA